uniref:ARAD1C27258p n=1 Tax=Blastobotrys adeninivorans TaxID=409370 RepID=A0A060T1V0_BLAAD
MDLGQILGSPESTTIPQLVQLLGDPDETKSYGSVKYYCFYSKGIAIGVDKGRVDSADFYKGGRYTCAPKELLPEWLAPEMTGKQFVETFGEPVEKGGGGKGGIDIWLRWKDFQVDIKETDWDKAKDQPWTSVTIFEP